MSSRFLPKITDMSFEELKEHLPKASGERIREFADNVQAYYKGDEGVFQPIRFKRSFGLSLHMFILTISFQKVISRFVVLRFPLQSAVLHSL